MSQKYPGGIISKTAPVPSGPYADSTAPGIWTLEQQAAYAKQGNWPTAGNVDPSAFIENLFSTYLYTGNSSTQTITNGIDLSGKGGLVWIKDRAASNHLLMTTDGGPTNRLRSNGQPSYVTSTAGRDLSSFNSNGFSLGIDEQSSINTSGEKYVSWSFRKQPKFFDVVTWTGNGANRTIAHNLGSVPGCIIIGATTALGTDWAVYHRSLANTEYLTLNSTSAKATGAAYWNSTTATSSVFSLGTDATVNYNTGTYIAYLFAHDAGGFGLTGTDNVISCGSFTTDGSGNATVSLGYEPQWTLQKRTDSTGNWFISDVMRGMTVSAAANLLRPNLSTAESTGGTITPTATGFTVSGYGTGLSIIYIAIRRGPMKVPTSGTSVFATNTLNTTTPGFVSNFVVDMSTYRARSGSDWYLQSRLTAASLYTNTTDAENALGNVGSVDRWQYQTGWRDGGGPSTDLYSYMFKRAPGFFDEVCYLGTGSTQNVTHNLGVIPGFIVCKRRNGTANWCALAGTSNGTYESLYLNTTVGTLYTAPSAAVAGLTATTFNPQAVFPSEVNTNGDTYVAYLFATCAGVSKVGSYTGTGTTKQIDCGFTGGARFVLIKRTDSTGDWYVWDSARGIVAGNDPYLLLNSTAAEVTNTDYVDTYSAGFEISSTAPAAINANGGTFIFLAIA